mgnify:CR=1 FL=1
MKLWYIQYRSFFYRLFFDIVTCMSTYEIVVGLEVHSELNTKTKMFCDSKNDPNERHPNINICPICMGHPGTLPVINAEAVKKVMKIGLAMHGEISEFSQFDRKQYFYPDLPKGYQISQYKHPIIQGGYLDVPGMNRQVRLTRIHLEEDAGRLVHEKNDTLVDYNRAGVPLMELVTEPDVRTAEEARAFAEELQKLLRYTGVSNADMEKGEMRIEANVSVHRPDEPYGTKVEVKNINSFRAVEKAIRYETERQSKILDDGGKVAHETRGWDDEKEITVSQRKKEEANDYRYFPEPDLPPLKFTYQMIEEVLKSLPELPAAKRERFEKEYALSGASVESIISDARKASFFEQSLSELAEALADASSDKKKVGAQLLVNYLTSDLANLLNEASASIDDTRISPKNFAELISLLISGHITSTVAKGVLREMFQTGGVASSIVKEKNLGVSSDTGEIERVVEKVITSFEKPAADFKAGKTPALQFLIGQAMKELRGRSNPDTLKELFIRKLSGL